MNTPHAQTVTHLNTARTTSPTPVPPPSPQGSIQPPPHYLPPLDEGGVPVRTTLA